MADAAASGSGSGKAGSTLLPTLPTPDTFPFPYPQPYAIQLDLMRTVFRAIEERKIAIVESPTGTGKSLTLLTSTLTWLAAHHERLSTAVEADLRAKLLAADPEEPAWVIEHAVRAQLAGLRAAEDTRRERLARARQRERRAAEQSAKRARTGQTRDAAAATAAVLDDDEFLPDDRDEADDGVYMTKEVKQLMQRFEASKPKQEEPIEEDVPKVYYASRTHTQLRQLTSELLKTSFVPTEGGECAAAADGVDRFTVSLVPLASRKQLCINDKVRAQGRGGGDDRLNEACLDMQKSGKQRCEFLPKEDGTMLEACDSVLASVRDIEDIVTQARKLHVCPYYSTRRAAKQAQIVTLPYNLLLQKNARDALGIDLTDQIVVIDEAHNLIDTILSIYSTSLRAEHVSRAGAQLAQYLSRFKTRLKPVHALWIQQALVVLHGLGRVCASATPGSTEVLDVNALAARLGGGGDQVNLVELVAYLQASKLARKVSGFADMLAAAAQESKANAAGPQAKVGTAERHTAMAAFHTVEAFLLSLTDSRADGRVILSSDAGAVTLKYVLLNPAERFREVAESARAIVLAGGTMEPISEFFKQLLPTVPRDRFTTLSCAHVIPKANMLVQVVSRGPRKHELEFKHANKDDPTLMAELGAVVQSAVGLVPDGLVVFLPSYAFLDRVKAAWAAAGLLDKLAQRKALFYEPKTSAEVDDILRDYALAISRPGAKGAIMFAVVGGKLSEGINFSDRLGRCVVMVGLPFANVGSVELQERMKYVSALPGAGREAANELYENLCMRAVNQSIGRAIRHANDYATILLVDKRFSTPRIRSKLPRWIGEDVQTPADWTAAARAVAGFFREKRARENAS